MRTVIRMLAVVGVAAFLAGSAQAAAVLSIFQSDGDNDAIACESGGCSNVNLAAPGNVVFDVFLTVGPEGLGSYGSDVRTGGKGTAVSAANVGINVPYSTVNCPGTQPCSLSQAGPAVITTDVTPNDSIGVGIPNGLNLVTLGLGPIGGTYRVARMTFTMNASGAVSLDNISAFDNANLATAVSGSQSVTVTVVPEPGTVALLGLGIFGLAVAGRRRA